MAVSRPVASLRMEVRPIQKGMKPSPKFESIFRPPQEIPRRESDVRSPCLSMPCAAPGQSCPLLHAAILLSISLVLASCGKRTETTTKETVVLKPDSIQQAKLKEVSERWKKERNIEDFIYLKDTWVTVGSPGQVAKAVLGEPLTAHRAEDGKEYWMFVRCDFEKKQFESWSLLLDVEGKVARWDSKGIR